MQADNLQLTPALTNFAAGRHDAAGTLWGRIGRPPTVLIARR